ncbi:MAG: 1-(5-phosphoribosyl)-5-[(5-phosphoribosylamino)methylideneamino]imidazole-4-carboxamide isomerase [Saprospiraceae bacterium]|nr:1-(5-phosphoribosyl)-5-[(5-phosphoribosylamino)methylideneamino]imidazole-4-carboxamide isomerase [Saprospiraceae bacterium]
MITIIPAIDLINGQCVRLTKGDYNTEKVYDQDPVAVAKSFERMGATHLHIVDLDAARGMIDYNLDTIASIIRNTNLEIEVGGGIRKYNQIDHLLKIGANKVIIGSMAQKEKSKVSGWVDKAGADQIIIGADVSNGYISIHGWQEESTEKIEEFLAFYYDIGVKNFLCTDVAKDGMLEGPAIDLYTQLMKLYSDVNIIASGGVSSIDDLKMLDEVGMKQAIVGKAIYENRIDLGQAIKAFQRC